MITSKSTPAVQMMSDVTTGEVYGSLYLYFVFINSTSSDRPSWLVGTAVVL